MTTDNDDEKFEAFVQSSARGYNEPPVVPREEMWTAIGAARAEARRASAARHRWLMAAAGMAATLVVGVAVGRYGFRESPATVRETAVRVAPVASAASTAAYDVVTQEHLSRAEMLLVAYTDPAVRAPGDSTFARWARDVLSNTRLLLDSPAATDPVRRQLLADLERVLVQMVQKSPAESDAEARALVERSLSHTDMLTRLRSTSAPAANGGS
ncbi:MAG TPA: hypothetical protein VG916_05815 [Gemmatimonadaceae bacterium]|nr:hypothetical protein [Gemmatimonadaceae bacterium]